MAVQREALRWARKHELITAANARSVADANLGVLVARIFPLARRNMLQVAADWMMAFCAIDDLVEGIQPDAGFEISSFLDTLLDAFSRGLVTPSIPLTAAFVDLRRRLDQLAAPAWLSRFSQSLGTLFDAYRWEHDNRVARATPSIRDYLRLRSITVGVDPFLLLGELALGIRHGMPRADSLVADMMTSTNKCVAWANDLFTYTKESELGECHNLVLLLAGAHSISVAAAAAEVVIMHNREMETFLCLQEELRATRDPDRDLERFVELLKSSIRGHYDWAQGTLRYAR